MWLRSGACRNKMYMYFVVSMWFGLGCLQFSPIQFFTVLTGVSQSKMVISDLN